MATLRVILANIKTACEELQSDLDKELTEKESVQLTDAIAASLDTVNPTIREYPPTIPTS